MRNVLQVMLLAMSLLAASAHAQWVTSESQRAGKWETSLGLFTTSSESAQGSNGSSLDIDSGYGLAFGVGYNFTQHLALRFDGAFLRADYDAVLNTEDEGLVDISHRMTGFNGQINGIWNILEGNFTPYLQAGVGWTYLDSNVTDGPPATGCWWDPWWGYVCAPFYSTYTDTNFSFNIGAGLRYEFGRGMFARGGWEQTYIDNDSGSADPSFDSFRIEIGWLF